MTSKPRLVIIGAGWAGFYLCEHVSQQQYDITVIAPRRTSAFTPLLASAAVGLFNFYLAEEPIRSKKRSGIAYLKAKVTGIDFDTRTCHCRPAFDDDPTFTIEEFDITYDVLIIAPGCEPNTFNTPGVAEHAIFIKNVSDAMAVRKRLFDLLEEASLPTSSVAMKKQLLHIAVVGGGPTGIELTAELDDLCKHEIADTYPDVAPYLNISIFDVADKILGSYDQKLYQYANQRLSERNVQVRTSAKIKRVDKSVIYLAGSESKSSEEHPYGMLVWATGNQNVPLLGELEVRKTTKGLRRVLTDSRLRVFMSSESDTVYDNVYALGDAADIEGLSLPTTAEVAVQKAKYLVQVLNAEPVSEKSFSPVAKGLVSYIGNHDGIIMGTSSHPDGWTGRRAWLAWRSGSVLWTRSWRNRVGIILTWTMNLIFGRDLAIM